MSDASFKVKLSSATRSTWASVAFMVESVLLLVFLVASLAVLTQVFVASLNRSVESRALDAATIATASIAEHFAANPKDVADEVTLGDLRIVTTVTEHPREDGILYTAHIEAYDTSENVNRDSQEPVYALDTARYEPKEK